MDIVASGTLVAGPAVGFRDGVPAVSTRCPRSAAPVGGDFGEPQAAWDVSVPEFDGADDEHLAAWLRPCPPVGGSSLVRNGRLASSFPPSPTTWLRSRQDVARSRGEQPSAAVRADTELFLELQGRDAVGVGRHQVGGPEPDGERHLLACRIVPAVPRSAGGSRRTRVCFSAQRPSLFMAARGTRPEAVRPAHFVSQAAQASSWECWKARRLSGTCFRQTYGSPFPRP